MIQCLDVVGMNGYPVRQGRILFCGDGFSKEDLAKMLKTNIHPCDLVLEHYGDVMEIYDGTCGEQMAVVKVSVKRVHYLTGQGKYVTI